MQNIEELHTRNVVWGANDVVHVPGNQDRLLAATSNAGVRWRCSHAIANMTGACIDDFRRTTSHGGGPLPRLAGESR